MHDFLLSSYLSSYTIYVQINQSYYQTVIMEFTFKKSKEQVLTQNIEHQQSSMKRNSSEAPEHTTDCHEQFNEINHKTIAIPL